MFTLSGLELSALVFVIATTAIRLSKIASPSRAVMKNSVPPLSRLY